MRALDVACLVSPELAMIAGERDRDLPVAAIGDHADLTAWHWSDHVTTVHNGAA